MLRGLGKNGGIFGLRLFLSFGATLAVLGVVGYLLILHQLRTSQIESYSATQRADAVSFEAVAAAAGSEADAIRAIDDFIDVIAKRPGTLETLLINQRGLVVAAGHEGHVGGTDLDPRIEGALLRGREYAGHEADENLDGRDFEFIMPVSLPGERYAYEVTYGHSAFDAQLSSLRRILIMVGLLTLVGGGGIFYLVGGRTLMRHHRVALQRATCDGLTELPNQGAFQDEFPRAVANAIRHEETLALVVMGLDDFKFVNDRHGHDQGDALLKRVAAVLRDGRPGDRVYRNGGDEFAALLPHTDGEGAHVFTRRLQRAMTKAGLRISIGVSAQRAGQPADSLRAEAEAALNEAKRRGGNQHVHFDEIRESAVVTTLEQKGAVRKLIDEGKVTTLFQPIWDLAAGRLLGVEALSRPDPSYNLSGPIEAFDLAEQIGRVHELDVICASHALSSMPPLPQDAQLHFLRSIDSLDLLSSRIIQGGQGYGLGRPSPTIQISRPQALSLPRVAA